MCLICDRIQMIKDGTNPYFVKELETGYVVIGDHQHFYNERGSIWWYPHELMNDNKNRPSADELEEMKRKLLSELER